MGRKERRANLRKRVLYGATVTAAEKQSARPCLVRNFSDAGALVEFHGIAREPADEMWVAIDCKRVAYQARLVWWHDNVAGLAFCADAPRMTGPDPDIEERLRVSQKKNRELKQRVRQLLGQD